MSEESSDFPYVETIKGTLVKAKGLSSHRMGEIVLVGENKLVGEIIRIDASEAIIQVYEPLDGLVMKEPVFPTGKSLTAELGPGLLTNIFDGIQRPLKDIRVLCSNGFIPKGIHVNSLDRKKRWPFVLSPTISKGKLLNPGDIIGEIPETDSIRCKIMVPPHVSGEVIEINLHDEYTIDDYVLKLLTIKGDEVKIGLMHEWPVRIPRPCKTKLPLSEPLVTGQRVIDMLFPLAKGGTAAVPGAFGTGKTVTQHALSKWSNADIIVYIGCGERGNEMTSVLQDFPKLIDPYTKNSLLDKTVLIANTSNMPVAARESSIYMGLAIAEFYRDQGLSVLLTADSTSRWAEALREIAGQLEDMPVEEGYPAYLGSRLANFYERAGKVQVYGSPSREGSINITAAVSPPGGDFSEPVTTNTKRFVKTFWALDPALANKKHFPSINWLNSYSGYTKEIEYWALETGLDDWGRYRQEILMILQRDAEMQNIVELIGSKALPADEQLLLLVAQIIKEGFLQQNAFSIIDAFCSIEKQMKMMKLISSFYQRVKLLSEHGCPIPLISNLECIQNLKRMKETISNDDISSFDDLEIALITEIEHLGAKYSEIGE